MMKLTKILGFTALAMAVSACAPRNDTLYLDISEALNSKQGKEIIDPNIKLYFGKPAPGNVVVAKNMTINPKINAADKTDIEACQLAFIFAVRDFEERAQREGATKVGNLVSYYEEKEYKSTTKYECHADVANLMAVALKGDIVK